jgi:hypothetical protein
MKLASTFLVFILILSLSAHNKKLTFKLNKENNLLNGSYISWHANRQLKSKGEFKDNQRIGQWQVYDSLGIMRMERNYENSFIFTQLPNVNLNNKVETQTPSEIYSLKKNEEGFFIYPLVKEEEVVFSRRIWRRIKAEPINSVLFDGNRIAQILTEAMINRQISAYGPEFHEFSSVLNDSLLQDLSSHSNLQITSMLVLEEWFYSTKRQMSEVRILGLCPVTVVDGKDNNLFWLYYPEIRSILAKEKINDRDNPLINNLDDIFFFRKFSSEIYDTEESHLCYNKERPPLYILPEESDKAEASLIELEHDIWLKIIQKPVIE